MSKKTTKRLTKKEVRNKLLVLFEHSQGQQLEVKTIFGMVGALTHPAKMLVLDVLKELVLDDFLSTDQRGNYRHAERAAQLIEGVFRRKRNGHNVFVPNDGGKELLVTELNAHHALDGDVVRVSMVARRRSHTREAEVVEIIRRAKDTFVGRLHVEHDRYGFLLTERQIGADIFIPGDLLHDGKTGDKAIVKIVDWPDDTKCPRGEVVDILGQEGENDTEMHAILVEYGLP